MSRRAVIISNGTRRRCTAAATLTTADGSLSVEVSLLEARDGSPPQVRVATRDARPQIVALTLASADASVVEIALPRW